MNPHALTSKIHWFLFKCQNTLKIFSYFGIKRITLGKKIDRIESNHLTMEVTEYFGSAWLLRISWHKGKGWSFNKLRQVRVAQRLREKEHSPGIQKVVSSSTGRHMTVSRVMKGLSWQGLLSSGDCKLIWISFKSVGNWKCSCPHVLTGAS